MTALEVAGCILSLCFNLAWFDKTTLLANVDVPELAQN